MHKRKNSEEGEKDKSERWLLTYSDMMNNLLILFMVLYAMSIIDMSKFKTLAEELANAFSKTPMTEIHVPPNYNELIIPEENPTPPSSKSEEKLEEEFDQIYQTFKTKLEENGYAELVSMEKGDNYIKFRFGDNVLFYPDSPVIKTNNVAVLQYIGDMLSEFDSLIESIEIAGHTATTGQKTNSFFSWELSSDRAIAVLEFLVGKCGLPEEKMSISGYSRYHPVASNDTEESRQLNRRVEIKITRINSTDNTSE